MWRRFCLGNNGRDCYRNSCNGEKQILSVQIELEAKALIHKILFLLPVIPLAVCRYGGNG